MERLQKIQLNLAVIRHPEDLHMLILGLIFMGFAFIRHKDNLKRLKNKTENKIGQKVKIEEKKEENGIQSQHLSF